jgi:hypothetical protein
MEMSYSSTIVPTFWCMCFSTVSSTNQVGVLIEVEGKSKDIKMDVVLSPGIHVIRQ